MEWSEQIYLDPKLEKHWRRIKWKIMHLSLIHISLMAEAGVFSYKIEGRMKQLEYAVGVTEIYRKYMDILESGETYQHAEKKDIDALLSLGNRNGFTEGYYKKRNDKSVPVSYTHIRLLPENCGKIWSCPWTIWIRLFHRLQKYGE